ncbi:transport and Golgi organization protein 6 homolog, partial [Copidosoma floridanum]|uniref:transport and Golgi organization protein 6 homolog n=1 Tax=Copidosoma floridanum TaxID=29053 RepID=UPI000C6F9920
YDELTINLIHRWKYLKLLLCTIVNLLETELSVENPLLSVNQLKILKTAFESAASIGIIPSLFPNIKIHMSSTRPRIFKINFDDSILEMHKKLSHTVKIFLQCFENDTLRPVLIPQLDCLLAALLQISHAPLAKPVDTHNTTFGDSESKFIMTTELYDTLKKEQEFFHQKLQDFIEKCPQSTLIKGLMVIMGIKNNPKWLQVSIRNYLTNRIMQPNGVGAITVAICDDVSDVGKCWDKLDVTARLIAASGGKDAEAYYNSVCSQIVSFLNSKDSKQTVFMTNCYIKALHDHNPDICVKKIMRVIMEPLQTTPVVTTKQSNIIKTEEEVSQCIKNLCKLFIVADADFKCLPIDFLTVVALPLFYLYVKTYKSVYVHRSHIRQLILKVLESTSTTEIFSAFLKHKDHKKKYGNILHFRFGVNCEIEITSEDVSINYEEFADCLFDLVSKDRSLSFKLFSYLLKVLPKLSDAAQNVQKGKLLETLEDMYERIEKQLTAVKLLTLLSSSTLVQEEQVKNPEPLLEFIKFYFCKVASSSKDEESYEQDVSMLYTSVMLIKVILTDKNITKSWEIFEDFVTSIKKQFDFTKIPPHVVSILEEVETTVKKKGKSSKSYYDLSSDKQLNEFDKALADLADPLLPVRAHGIICLTKLIENRHPEVKAKEDFLLCLFQKNLDHEDSFIYLAAVNGICALSSKFPDKVIEILIQEFIGLTQQTKNRDVAPETRAKLGEILVKTTRALGEMIPKYKSLLINGFLCGTRDPDPLVRASSLSCLGELCKMMGFRLGNLIIEILHCIGCIVKTDKDDSCRRAGVLVATLLLRGLGKDALVELGENLVTLYRSLKQLRDNDKDPVLQLHAQLALEEFDDIVQQFLFAKPKLEKTIFLLPS